MTQHYSEHMKSGGAETDPPGGGALQSRGLKAGRPPGQERPGDAQNVAARPWEAAVPTSLVHQAHGVKERGEGEPGQPPPSDAVRDVAWGEGGRCRARTAAATRAR